MNTATILISRGTLHGDTISLFLFALFMESLLRCLSIESRGYKPSTQSTDQNVTCITYDDYGYHICRRHQHYIRYSSKPQNITFSLRTIHGIPPTLSFY